MLKDKCLILGTIIALCGVISLQATTYQVKLLNEEGSIMSSGEIQIIAEQTEKLGAVDVLVEDNIINVTLPFGNYLRVDGKPHVVIGDFSDALINARVREVIQSLATCPRARRRATAQTILATACANSIPLTTVFDYANALPNAADEEES